MVSKNNHYLNQQKSGRKFEKYSIKKLKVGAASVLVGAGFFFGYHVEASEVTKTESVVNANNEALVDKKINTQTSVESTLNKESRATEQPAVTGVVEEKKVETTISQTLQTAELQEKVSALQTEINRIRSNEQQKSQIEKAEKLVKEAKLLLSSNTASQTEVDAKAKEISSLTNILKSIKAEEVSKENKNKDSRNGKKMEEGTGFRTGEAATSTTTGVGADVVDATDTPAVTRPPYTEKRVAEGLAKQIAWLDFSDTRNWTNVDIENGNVYLKEGSIYEKEIMPNYRIKLKVKSLKPFQATEIYRKRMEANNATAEEKATFNPNATNGVIDRTDNNPVRITAQAQDQWSEIRDNGINTNGRKTSIKAESLTSNIGVQFEVSGTYKGNPVRPAVVMADAESANPGENIVFTTNGSGWQQIIDLKKNYTDAHRYKPLNYYTDAYKRLPDASWGNDVYNTSKILNAGEGNKIVPKYFTSPDQETGGLGTGVFGPGVTAGKYSVPVVLTKNATEVGMYVFSSGAQAAMIGVAPIDEGDAPTTYGEATHTMNTRDGLTGDVVKQPYLGSERPDADTGTPKNWHGDDDTDTADEGINQLLPDSLKGSEGNIIKANVSSSGYYTLNIQAHTGGADRAYVRSWLDFNNNGQFDSDEASDIVEITQDGDVQLHFINKTQKDAEGLLAAGTRVRIATSREEIEKPTGLAFSGEVEDFNAKITHPPKGDKQTTIGNAIIGNKVEKQSATVHFTPKGKYIYTQDDVNAEIDTTVKPVYINNKTGEKVTLSDENTYTVRGQGTYKFTPNGKDVDVEFTPAKGFVGKAHGFTIRRQDTNKTTTDWGTSDEAVAPNVNDVLNTMDGLYIPEVIMPTVEPTPNNVESRNIQGFAQKGKPTFNVVTSDTPVTASAKHPARLIDPRTNTLADSAIVDALDPNNNKVGTYKIAPETGEVTFTPNIDYKGEVQPVRVSVPVVVAHDKDDNDITVTKEATYTPRIIPVSPTAEASTTRDVQGKAQVSRIVFDTVEENADKNQTVNFDRSPEAGTAGEHVELDKETLTLLTPSGAETNTVTTDQGEYVLDKVSKTITFTPKKEFVGTATAVNIRIKDMNGTKVETTYTPTVIEVTPTGKNSATSGVQGLTQKSPIVFNQRNEEDGKTLNFDTGDERVALKPETLTLLNGSDKVKSITVPNVGTYELVDNAITFTPAPAYHGTAEGVNVQVADENGNVVTKKYVPTVTELTVTPENKTTKNIQGETQEGTPTFTIPAESTNATVTSRKLVDPADQTEKDSVKVEGKGTFTIDGNGKVTFTPLPTYKDDVPPITVKATVTITNAKNESATITSTASYKPIIVPAEIDKAPATSTNLQGLTQTGTPTFTPKTIDVDGVQKTISVQANSYKLVKDGVESESLPAYKAGTTDQIGTYTINPATGQVTFTPTDKTYTGAVQPVDVQATGSNGVNVQTTYTPTITPVTPTKEPSATTDVQGKKQVSRIVLDTVETDADKDKTVNFNKGSETGANGERVNLNPDTLTLLNDTGAEVTSLTTSDGEYVLDKANKTITFTPNKNFVGPATPVKVQIKDVNGTKVETTYTPTVTDVTMTSEDKESSAPQGKTQTGTPTFTVSTPEVRITGYKLLNPTGNTPVEGNEIEVPDQGTYRINPTTGEVTFIPKPGFTGPATGITVQATDENGETKDAKYKPTVTALTITPQPVTTTNIQGETQEGTPTFPVPAESNNVTVTSRKLVDPADQTEKDSVTVEGKGTFTIDGNGKVTFTPLPTYKGDVDPITVKATVTITNDKNESTTIPSTTTYKPIIVSAEIDKEPATSTNLQGFVQTGTPAFKSKTVDVDGTPKTITVQPNSYKLVKDGTETNTLPAYKKGTTDQIGTYTIDSATGQVTFTPSDKTYSGEVAPVDVQATGSNGVKVQTTYTPIITPVTPTAEASATSDVQGKKQTSSIVLDTPENSADKDKTVNFNKGSQVGANGERVNLNPDTLTLLNDAGDEVSTLTTSDGEYVLDKVSKTITFTPNKTFTGQAKAVKVQIKDANGTKVETTYTPTVTQVTPTGTNATSSGLQGKVQTGKPVFNGGVPEVPMNDEVPATLEGADQDGKVVIAGKGTYTVAKDGTVTFTPDKNFVGVAPAVTVKRVDKNGTIATATYTPTVTDVSMTSENKTSEAPQGKTQTGTPTFTISTPDVRITEYKLVDPTNNTPVEEVEVENQGTYSIDKATGEVTFVPKPGFTGPTTGITVRATDENGETKDATYTPSVTPLKVTPENKTTTNIQGLPQEATPTFKLPKGVTNAVVTERKLIDPSTKALTNSVTVDGKGTFTINANGKVTFTPEPSYVGDVPAIEVQGTITVLNDNNDSTTITSKASYKPIIVPIELEKTPAESTNVQGLVQKGTPTFTPQSVDVNGVEKTVTVKPNSYKLVKDGTETDTIPAYKKDTQEVIGKYTIDPQTGEVTFTPTDKTYTGEVEPATVQATGSNNVKVQTTYTPIIKPVKPVGTDAGSEGIQGAPQSGTPTFKSGNENIPMTVSATNPAKLVDPTTNQPIEATEIDAKNAAGEKVGLYTINPATGEVTFTPEPGFSGTPVPATVQAKDGNGTPTTATYTPVVKAAVPSGDNQVTSDIQGAKQTVTPVFTPGKNTVNNQEVSVPFEATSKAKLIDPSKTGDEREVTMLVVENQGTYTIDDNGVVTFTPLPTFKGEATAVSIERKDKNGTVATATFKPSVVGVTPSATEATTTKVQGATQETPVTFTPGKATIGTAEKSVPMDPASYKLLGGQEGKTPLDTVPAMSEDGTKEVGTYTIKVVDGKPVVTFTPTDKTYAGKLKPVTVQGKDTNGSEATTTYTPVITPIVPTAENGTSEGPQGVEQTGSVTFKPGKEPGTENTPVAIDKTKMTLLGTDGNPVESLTVSKDGKEIGTYTLVKDPTGVPTGEVKFTPTDKSFVGEVPAVTVQVKDANGTPATATYTPTFTEVTPTSKPSETTGFQGLPQTSRVVLDEKDEADNTTVNFDKGNDKVALVPSTLTLVNADGAKVTSVTVPNEGTYELNNGVITFTPLPTFHGKASGVSVQAEDVNGKVAKTTYTPTVTEVRPVGTNAGSEGIQGAVQEGTPSFKSGNENVPMTVSATNPAKLVVDGQPVADTTIPATDDQGQQVGTYTIEPATGKVTFTPNPGFSGTPVPATVQAKDGNGTPTTATYTPVVKAAVPSGDNQVTSDIQGAKQTVTPVFTPGKNTVNNQEVSVPFEATSKAKLIDPSKTGDEREVTMLVVENQGTYTIDDNGVVTFTPLPTFKGEATAVSIVRKDKNGTAATATYKPSVVGVTPSATAATTTKVQGSPQESEVTFTPGKATIGTEEKSVPMDPTAYKLLGGQEGKTPLDRVPAMSEDGTKEVGTYTIKVVDGKPVVTFTPTDKTYAGKLKPVTVQGKDTNGSEATTTYTPVITPIVPTAENGTSEGPQGVEQTGSVTFKPGKEPGTENTPVAIDKTKMTLLGTDGNPVESLTVSKDGKEIGTYTLVKDPNGVPTGEVKFTPTDKSYVGEVPPATVQVQDANGTPAKGTYTPTLTKVTPTGKDTTSTGLQGKVQTGTPTFTPGTPEVPMDDESPATFEDGNNTKTIDKVGTYTVAKDGTVTFTPDKDFVGEAPEVTVKRVDKNGTAVTAKYKPIVAKVLPTGEGSETEGAKGRTQTSAVVFDKKDEDKSTVNFNKGDETVGLNPSTLTLIDKNGNPSTEVKVPGEGTYTLANNVITFTPEKDFAGKATGVTVQVKDINGTPLEKTYTPTVRPVTTFVDPAGNVITVDKNNKPVEGEVDGSKQPTKDIYGYKFVRTETDNKGNTKHIYEQAEGKSVKVTYVSTTNETLSDSQTVETKDKFIGTDYDASIEALKLERIEKDGKVYLLKERKSDSATENGKLSDKEQTVTYVYEEVQEPASNQKYGNVVVVYKDKFGRPISGTTDSGKEVASTVIDTPNSPLTTKYDTTDHKPQIITTKDGKKYKLIKVLKSSDAEKSGVKARTSVITYVYESLDNTTEYPEAHIGLVLVNYLDEEGNPISGKTPEGKVVPNIVVDTEADLVGKDYDTTDHKVSTIIVENGDVYELLKVSETSVEKGKLTEGTINVDYIYHKVVTKFVDENGKEIKSPEKGRTDKKDIPEYTFKETKKDVNGNTVHVYTKKSSSTPVTPTPSTPSKEKDSLTIWKDGDGNNIKSPEQGKKEPLTIDGYIYERSEVDKDGNTVHIYRKVSSETPVVNEKETLFVDANGKPLQPAKKGQHPHETIPGYEFVRTETDANGNVRHVYRPVAQSQATVNPSPTVEQRKNELPNTGTGDEFAIFGAAAASILAGLGIAIPGKKKEEEK